MALPSRSSSSWPRSRSRQSATAVTPVVAKTTRPAMRTKSLRRRVTIGARERSTRMPPRCGGGPFFTWSRSWGASSSWPPWPGPGASSASSTPTPASARSATGPARSSRSGPRAPTRAWPASAATTPRRSRGSPCCAPSWPAARRPGRRPTRRWRSAPAPPATSRTTETGPRSGNSRGHRIHFEEKGIACVTCHAEGMHGFHPLTESCKKCHGEHTVRAQGMAKLHCFVCHDFLSPDPGLLPTRRDCLRCHRAEGVHPARFSDAAPMQFDCGTCHKPHAATPAGGRRALHRVPRGGRDGRDCTPATCKQALHHLPRPAPLGGRARRVPALPRRGRRSTPTAKGCTTCHLFRSVARAEVDRTGRRSGRRRRSWRPAS